MLGNLSMIYLLGASDQSRLVGVKGEMDDAGRSLDGFWIGKDLVGRQVQLCDTFRQRQFLVFVSTQEISGTYLEDAKLITVLVDSIEQVWLLEGHPAWGGTLDGILGEKIETRAVEAGEEDLAWATDEHLGGDLLPLTCSGGGRKVDGQRGSRSQGCGENGNPQFGTHLVG